VCEVVAADSADGVGNGSFGDVMWFIAVAAAACFAYMRFLEIVIDHCVVVENLLLVTGMELPLCLQRATLGRCPSSR
jgi:hypothetical protein